MGESKEKRPSVRLVSSGAGAVNRPTRPRGPVTIFHNPRCSSSRAALSRLEQAGLDPIVVEYLETPPSALQLADLARKAGLHPREMIRAKEPEFVALGRKLSDLTAAAAIAAMVEHPILIQRPIVVRGSRALIARPPERADEILGPPAPVIPIARLRKPKPKKSALKKAAARKPNKSSS
jgi:arsenate reductase